MPPRPEQLSRPGEFLLEEAILDVLLKAKHKKKCVGPSEISESAGIYRKSGVVGMNDAIVHGILNKLFDQGKVQRCSPLSNGRSGEGWELTDPQFKTMCDNSSLFKYIISIIFGLYRAMNKAKSKFLSNDKMQR